MFLGAPPSEMDASGSQVDQQSPNRQVEDQSTLALINDNLGHSTSSLVQKDINDLLKDAILKGSWQKENLDFTGEVQEPAYDYRRRVSPISSPVRRLQDTEGYYQPTRFSLQQNDSYFRRLFNRTQVLLLRNDFSLDFLIILRRYVHLLIEEDENPMDDQYVLELQNELDKGFVLTARLYNLLELFLSHPSNRLMMLAQYEQRKRRSIVESVFTRWKLLTKVDMNLMQLSLAWNSYLRKKYFSSWRRKTRFKCKELEMEADNLINFKCQANTFDMWMKRTDAQKVKQDLADVFFLQKYLTMFKEEVKIRANQIEAANSQYRRRCVSRAFSSLKLQKIQKLVEERVTLDVKKEHFRQLSERYNDIRSMNYKAALLARHHTLSPFMNKWRLRFAEDFMKKRQMGQLEILFREKMAFKVVKDFVDWKDREAHAIAHLNRVFVRYVFQDLWYRRYKERQLLNNYCSKQDAFLTARQFSSWKAWSHQTNRALCFNEKAICKRTFRLLRLGALSARLRSRHGEVLVRKVHLRWLEATRLELVLADCRQKLLKKFWNRKLKNRYWSLVDLSSITKKCRDSQIARENFDKWLSAYRTTGELQRRAEFFKKVRAIVKLKTVLIHCDQLNAASRTYAIQKDNHGMQKFFSIWQSSMRIQIRLKLEIVLDQYLSLKERSTMKKHMAIWLSRFQYVSLKCTKVADALRERAVTSVAFAKAIEKLELHEEWWKVAVELNDQSSLVIAFDKLKLGYNQVAAMQRDLARLQADRELSSLVHCMNVWTMKQLKCSRNSETVEIFKNRWNRAGLRAILLLWREKVAYGHSKHSDGDVQNFGLNEGDQDLITPTRIRNSGRITIPGSEKMKQNRMEAMRNHYRRARKAIPSPIRFSERLDTVTKKRLEAKSIALEHGNISPPPKMDLEKINRKLASKKPAISFKSIPEARLSPVTSSPYSYAPIVDRSLLSHHDADLDRSPSIR
ncbi:LAFA_0B02498g1_1 [Lachancea sp. 'fantastica']|nr:LAFA_0B02498g1_1 [Lachancea sp. 'fantastica']